MAKSAPALFHPGLHAPHQKTTFSPMPSGREVLVRHGQLAEEQHSLLREEHLGLQDMMLFGSALKGLGTDMSVVVGTLASGFTT
jgi:hypothetical protein